MEYQRARENDKAHLVRHIEGKKKEREVHWNECGRADVNLKNGSIDRSIDFYEKY